MKYPDTATEAAELLRELGYCSPMTLRNGMLACDDHDHSCALDEVTIERMFRFEGSSDPGDEMVVFGLHDRANDARGVLVSAYGMDAEPDVMQALAYIASKVKPRTIWGVDGAPLRPPPAE